MIRNIEYTTRQKGALEHLYVSIISRNNRLNHRTDAKFCDFTYYFYGTNLHALQHEQLHNDYGINLQAPWYQKLCSN